MPIQINFTLPDGLTRREVREAIVKQFLLEAPGTGTGERSSKYIYYVERLSDNNRIFLKRPARFNGFDFAVNVENYRFLSNSGRSHMSTPTHNNIFEKLAAYKADNNGLYVRRVIPLIHRIYNISCIDDAEYRELIFENETPCELILKCLKWLFVEQDINYWNYSGRGMLFSALRENNLI